MPTFETVTIKREKPPKKAGPYHNFNVHWFERGKEVEFAQKRGYHTLYIWKDADGQDVLTLCERDLVQPEK